MTGQVIQPFAVFVDGDGNPLENGYIYVGTVNQNPQTNPIALWWDADKTIPAAQPVRTIGGYAANQGSAGNLYVDALTYSITVRDSNGVLVTTRGSAPASVDWNQTELVFPDAVLEVLQALVEEQIEASQFRGDPVTLEIDGDGNVDCDLTLGLNYYLYMDQNINTFSFSNAPEIRIPNICVKIENSGAFDIATFEFTAEGGTVEVPDSFDGSLSPAHNATTDYGLALFRNNAEAKVMSIYPVLMQAYSP